MRAKVVYNKKFKYMTVTENTELQRVLDFAKYLWKLDNPKKTYGVFYDDEPYNFALKIGTFKNPEPRFEIREVNFKTFQPIGGYEQDNNPYQPKKVELKVKKG